MPSPNKNPNDIGAVWKKSNERGTEWLSIKLDIDQLLECTGGELGVVKLVAFEFKRAKTNDKQPDYQLLYPKKPAPPEPVERELREDEIPF